MGVESQIFISKPDSSGYSPKELEYWNNVADKVLEARNVEIDRQGQADARSVPVGTANVPSDPDTFLPDWRLDLPVGHPIRRNAEAASGLALPGSVASARNISQARTYLLNVLTEAGLVE